MRRGRTDGRLAAGVCIAGTLLTNVVGNNLSINSSAFIPPAFLVVLMVLAAFVAIALRSARFWPMWVAGLQLTTTSVHFMMFVSPALPGVVFGAALAFWSYPILILIGIGAWRTPLVERWRNASDIAARQAIS